MSQPSTSRAPADSQRVLVMFAEVRGEIPRVAASRGVTRCHTPSRAVTRSGHHVTDHVTYQVTHHVIGTVRATVPGTVRGTVREGRD